MDIKDVKKVVDDLQNKPFLCSKEAIETDSGCMNIIKTTWILH